MLSLSPWLKFVAEGTWYRFGAIHPHASHSLYLNCRPSPHLCTSPIHISDPSGVLPLQWCVIYLAELLSIWGYMGITQSVPNLQALTTFVHLPISHPSGMMPIQWCVIYLAELFSIWGYRVITQSVPDLQTLPTLLCAPSPLTPLSPPTSSVN